MIHHKLKTIFIHMPRCAGTAIRQRLSQEPDIKGTHNKHYSHVNWSYYLLHHGEKIFKSYFKFSVIRNPYDRVYSSFKRKSSIDDITYYDFEKWLVKLTEMPFKLHGVRGVLGSHFYWISDKMNFLIKYENFKEDWKKACKIIGIKNNIDWVNKGENHLGGYKEYHTKKTIEIVKKYFKKDLEVFGYDF